MSTHIEKPAQIDVEALEPASHVGDSVSGTAIIM